MMTWSKIQRTELASEAFICICDNNCRYHDLKHVDDMYQYLKDTNEPYDEALDWAIMFHDAVYDSQPEKELRSAKLFFDMIKKYRGCKLDVNDIDRVQLLILETVNHKVTNESYLKGSSAIIRADLHALADKVQTIENFVKIMDESIFLYGCTVEEFATNNIQFMSGLYERVATNMLVDKEHEVLYSKILNGIELTVRLAKTIKD
jgi:hypothetical protein